MSTQLNKKSVARNYAFLAVMLGAMILGSIVGWIFPQELDAEGNVISTGATVLEPLGTLFLNMMFCIVVPMVFSSIVGSVATMKSRKRAGKIMGTTVLTFVITGAIAAVIMIVIMKIFPPVLEPWTNLTEGVVEDPISIPDLIVNFFTVSDFSGLLSRSAMLPLIVFSILFGFGVNLGPGPDSLIARFLTSLSEAMMKVVQLVTYYAPIAFFGFFANLVATYGSQIATDYARALVVYYPLCFIYIFVAFPLFAWFGGGKGAVKEMFRHIAKPAITSLGTCSSVATIPTNMEEAEATGISKDVSEIVVPLGATMHMDGSCFSCILKITFLFGVFGRPFDSIGDMALMVIVAVLSSVGMSGVPGGGYWCDMGDCGAYLDCAADALSGKVKLDMGLPQQSPGVWSAQPIPEGVTVIPPCWLGPGAAVEPGALIGPHTVLEQNSWVGRRSLVQRSVLLPGARAEERTTLYGAILCKGAAARPEAVLNEGTVLGERALAEEKAVLLEGVRLWPARVAPAGTRLSRSITSSGRREPLLFGDGGVIRGVLGEDLGPEALMTIGGVLGCEGKVGLGYWGGNGARMLAQAAASGIAAAGGTPLAHDLECAAQAAWLAEHHQIPVSLFLEQEGDRIYLHLFGRSGPRRGRRPALSRHR